MVSAYLADIDEIVATLTETGEKISDSLTVIVTLNGLSSKFDSFVDIANQRNPPYTYDELKIALLNHEDRLNEGSDARLKSDCVMNTKANDRKQIKCFKCGKKEHIAPKCKVKFSKKTNKWCEYHKSKSHNTSECKMANSHNSVNSASATHFNQRDSSDIH